MDIQKLKKLREETNISLGKCKEALDQAGGDLDKAREIIEKKMSALAGKRKERTTGEGIIESYVHPNKKIGALVDLRCETDFVAGSSKFKNLAHDLAMQVAALAPRYVEGSEMPSAYLEEKKEMWKKEFKDKPQAVIEGIIQGRIKKIEEEDCLLEQPFIKNEEKKVKDIINACVVEFGENIRIERFVRYDIS